jgi:glycosyltransferase involved in cell wall biosynthesis
MAEKLRGRADTLVVVPAYNEGGSIEAVIRDIRDHAPEVDILVVNDGSGDETSEVAGRMGVFVVDLPFNLGLGGALQTGYQFAMEHGHEYAMQFDADGQHLGSEIPKLLTRIRNGDADCVVGSRFIEGGKSAFKSTLSRRLGIFFFSRLISLITRQKVTDPTSGFTVVGRKAIELFASYFPEDHPPPENLVILKRHKLRIVEVPTIMQERQASASSITMLGSVYFMIKVTLAVLVDLLRK